MQKLLLFILLFLAAGCEHADQKDKYIMHDDFYYYFLGNEVNKYYLSPCLDEYYIILKTEYLESTLDELHNKGFQITKGPTSLIFDFNFPEDEMFINQLNGCSSLCIKGSGDIAGIAHIIYSHHLYYNEHDSIVGRSNLFSVKFDSSNQESQIQLLLQYAKQQNIIPINIYYDLSWITFACTNNSTGNPVELSNWYIEVGAFLSAHPDFSENSID